MNQSVKQGTLTIVIIQLIIALISLLYFCLAGNTIPKGYDFAVTDDEVPSFNNNESIPAEHFGDDKSPTPVPSYVPSEMMATNYPL